MEGDDYIIERFAWIIISGARKPKGSNEFFLVVDDNVEEEVVVTEKRVYRDLKLCRYVEWRIKGRWE